MRRMLIAAGLFAVVAAPAAAETKQQYIERTCQAYVLHLGVALNTPTHIECLVKAGPLFDEFNKQCRDAGMAPSSPRYMPCIEGLAAIRRERDQQIQQQERQAGIAALLQQQQAVEQQQQAAQLQQQAIQQQQWRQVTDSLAGLSNLMNNSRQYPPAVTIFPPDSTQEPARVTAMWRTCRVACGDRRPEP